MALPWKDVVSNPEFQALPYSEQLQVRNEYFANVVMPNVQVNERLAAFNEFSGYADELFKSIKPQPAPEPQKKSGFFGGVKDTFSKAADIYSDPNGGALPALGKVMLDTLPNRSNQDKESAFGSVAKDIYGSALIGTLNIGPAALGFLDWANRGLLDEAAYAITGESMTERFGRAKSIESYGVEGTDSKGALSTSLNQQQGELNKIMNDKENGGLLPAVGYVMSNPRLASSMIAETLGISMGAGALTNLAERYAVGALTKAAAGGSVSPIARALVPMIDAAADLRGTGMSASEITSFLMKGTKKLPGAIEVFGERANIAVNFAMEAGDTANSTMSDVMGRSVTELNKTSSTFRTYKAQGFSDDDAKFKTAQDTKFLAGLVGGAVGGFGTWVSGAGAFEAKLFGKAGTVEGIKKGSKEFLKTIGKESKEEFIQGFGDQFGQDVGTTAYVDRNNPLISGKTWAQAGVGGVIGAAFGGGAHAVGSFINPAQELAQPTDPSVIASKVMNAGQTGDLRDVDAVIEAFDASVLLDENIPPPPPGAPPGGGMSSSARYWQSRSDSQLRVQAGINDGSQITQAAQEEVARRKQQMPDVQLRQTPPTQLVEAPDGTIHVVTTPGLAPAPTEGGGLIQTGGGTDGLLQPGAAIGAGGIGVPGAPVALVTEGGATQGGVRADAVDDRPVLPVDEAAKTFIERAREKIGEDKAISAANLAQRIAAHDGKKSVDTAAIAEAVQYQRGNIEVIVKDDLISNGESAAHKRAMNVGAIEDTGFAGLAKSVHDDIAASESKLLHSMIGSGRLDDSVGAYDRPALEKLKSILDRAKEDGVVTDQGLIKAINQPEIKLGENIPPNAQPTKGAANALQNQEAKAAEAVTETPPITPSVKADVSTAANTVDRAQVSLIISRRNMVEESAPGIVDKALYALKTGEGNPADFTKAAKAFEGYNEPIRAALLGIATQVRKAAKPAEPRPAPFTEERYKAAEQRALRELSDDDIRALDASIEDTGHSLKDMITAYENAIAKKQSEVQNEGTQGTNGRADTGATEEGNPQAGGEVGIKTDTEAQGEVIRVGESSHKDPGKPAEPATAAVVDKSLAKGDANSKLTLAQMKEKLLGDVDAAIATINPTDEHINYKAVREALNSQSRVTRNTPVLPDVSNENAADALQKTIGYTTFDVPGDGVFKVLNTIDNLTRFRAEVKRAQGFKNPAGQPRPETRAPLDRPAGETSPQAYVNQTLNDNHSTAEDLQNAIEVARNNNINDAELVKRHGELAVMEAEAKRLDLDTWGMTHKQIEKAIANPEDARKTYESEALKSSGYKPKPAAESNPTKEQQAAAILDRANVTGKDRLDIMRDFRDGKHSLDDLAKAYPVADSKAVEETPQENLRSVGSTQPSLADLNSGRAFADGIKIKIAEWVAQGTNNGARPMDRNWERSAVKRFVEANIKAQLSGTQTGKRAAAKIAVAKSETFADLEAAIEKYVEPSQEPSAAPQPKEPWQMTQKEYATSIGSEITGDVREKHADAIKKAHADGKAIPDSVLKSYPMLRDKFAPQSKQELNDKPATGKYTQPANVSDRAGQIGLAERAARLANLKLMNDEVGAYSDAEIQNVATNNIDAVQEYLRKEWNKSKEPSQEPKAEQPSADVKIGGYPVSGLGDKALTAYLKSSNEADRVAAQAEIDRRAQAEQPSNEHTPDDALPKGWKKIGMFYEFRGAMGSEFKPSQIAEALGRSIEKRGMNVIVAVPYHEWYQAQQTLKDAGLWSSEQPASGEGAQGIDAMYSRRIHGERMTAHDYIVPETPEFDANMNGDLAYTPQSAEKSGIEQLPIRLTVGAAREKHRGYGIMHMADNASNVSRQAPKYTDDDAENFARHVAAIARNFMTIYNETAGRYILFSPRFADALVVDRKTDSDTGNDYYSAITLVTAKHRFAWGDPAWVGRADFPNDGLLQSRASTPSSDKESQQPDRQPQRNQTSKFILPQQDPDRQPKKQPIITQKKRRTFTMDDVKKSQSATPARNPHTLSTLTAAIDKAMGQGFARLLELTGKFKIISSVDIGKYLGEGARFSKTTDQTVYWHGSFSGDLRGGISGLHLGTERAAEEALEARIGIPATGKWDGTREYGKTLLAGSDTQARLEKEDGRNTNTGFNSGAQKEDYYPNPDNIWLKYPDGTKMPMDAKPNILSYRLDSEMSNSRYSPHEDFKANAMMKGQIKKGTAKRGYYYENAGEDPGSISVVVPNGKHVTEIKYSADGSRILAFVRDGTTHLVYDNISSTDDNVANLLKHEIGVHALSLGRSEPEFQSILKQFAAMGKMGNKKVREAQARVPADTPAHLVDEESLGYYLEANPDLTFSQKIIAWFRAQLRKLGKALPVMQRMEWFRAMNKISESDIIYMASQALRSAPQTLATARDRGTFLAGASDKLYSQLRVAIRDMSDKIFQGSAANVRLHLMNNLGKYGIKKDELFWTGLEEFLNMPGKVSKADVLAFLDTNNVQTKDVMLGGALQVEQRGNSWVTVDSQGNEVGRYYSQGDARANAEEGTEATKFPTQVLPGGRDYVELLITLPGKRLKNPPSFSAKETKTGMFGVFDDSTGLRVSPGVVESRADAEKAAQDYTNNAIKNAESSSQFKSSHYPNHPNLISHVRLDTRDDAQGRVGTFLEEQQSDASIEASKQGFDKPLTRADYDAGRKTRAPGGIPPMPFIMSATGKGSTAHILLSLKKTILHAIEQGHEGNSAWKDVTEPESIWKAAFDFLGPELATESPLSIMEASMLPMLKHKQIHGAVVKAIPVNVVNILADHSFTPEQFVSRPDVVGKALPVNLRAPVMLGLSNALSDIGTRLRTALDSSLPAARNLELLPALNTVDLNAREVVRLLSPVSISDKNDSFDSAGRVGRTFSGAKPSISSRNNTGRGIELTTADLAKALNSHDKLLSGNPSNYNNKYNPAQQHSFISWTTGAQQKDRYSLAKQVNQISWQKNPDGTINIEADTNRGEPLVYKDKTANELEDIIGKDATKKIVDEVGKFDEQHTSRTRGRLENTDLEIGGEWADTLYGDENGLDANGKPSLMSQAVKEVARQLGIELKVESISMNTNNHYRVVADNDGTFIVEEKSLDGDWNEVEAGLSKSEADIVRATYSKNQPGFTLTPELRSKVTSAGMPLFSKHTAQHFDRDGLLDPTPKESEEVQKGVEGKTAIEAARFIAGNAPNEHYKLIAQKVAARITMMQAAGIKFNFKVTHMEEQVPMLLIMHRGLTRFNQGRGGKSDNSVDVYVQGSDVTGHVGVSYETVLHELIHAATMSAVFYGNQQQAKGTELSANIKELFDVHKAIANHFNARAAAGNMTEFEERYYNRMNNALASENEILAWALTNKDMQAYLETIQYSPKQTLWSKFVQSIRTYLGLTAEADTALSHVIRIASDILTSNVYELTETASAYDTHMGWNESATEHYANQANKPTIQQQTIHGTEPQLLPEETRTEATQRLWQDSAIRFKKIEETLQIAAAREAGYAGDNIHEAVDYMKAHHIANPISDSTDVYQAIGLVSSASEKMQDFEEHQIQPLVKEAAEVGITMADINEFLRVQHAPEANRQNQRIHRNDQSVAFGIDDAEAARLMAKFKARPDFAKLESISNKWQALTAETLKLREDAGVIAKGQADAYRATYQHYIPVKGVEEESLTKPKKGAGINAKDKRRMGHGLRDEHIIENIMRDRVRAINQIEQNKVRIVAHNLLIEANSPEIGTVGQPVKHQVFMPGAKHYMVMYHGTDVQSFDNLNDARAFVQDESEKYDRNAKDYYIDREADEGRVIRRAKPMPEEHEFEVMIDGVSYRDQFNDPLLARAFNNLGMKQVDKLLEGAREINVLLSKMYTAYSPTFLLKNPIRDAIQGAITNTSKFGIGVAAKIFKEYPHAMRELSRHLKEHGVSAEVNRFRKNGAVIGAAYVSDIERIGEDVMDAYNEYAGASNTYHRVYAEQIKKGRSENNARTLALMKAGKARFLHTPIIGHFLRFMEHANAVTENALRLATFNTLIKEVDAGGKRVYTDAQAAFHAKNLMNFNRKGELTTQAGALYLFFNPNAQGSEVLASALTTAKYRNQARALTGTMVLSAFLLAEMMRGGDDDDEKKWKKIPSALKDKNMIFGSGDTKIMLPIPYGYGVFHALGNAISDAMHGESTWKLGVHMTASMLENFSPIGNPVDSEHGIYQLMPTIPKMAMAPSVNENSFGTPITPDKFGQNKPDSATMYRNTKGTVYSGIASNLNELTGGDKYQSGLVDVSPETLRFWMSSLTGGAGQFAIDSINMGAIGLQGETPTLKETPILKSFTHEIGVGDARTAYWKEANKAGEALDAFRAAKKAHDSMSAQQMMKDDAPLLRLGKMAEHQQKLVKRLRDAQDQIRMNDALSLSQKREQIKELEKRETAIYDRFLSAVDSSRGNPSGGTFAGIHP